jgi:hypothetical protein
MNAAALEAAFSEILDVAASLGDVDASPQAADEWACRTWPSERCPHQYPPSPSSKEKRRP